MSRNFLPSILLSSLVCGLVGTPAAGQSVSCLSEIDAPLVARYEDALVGAVEAASQKSADPTGMQKKSNPFELDAVCDAAQLKWNSSRQEVVSHPVDVTENATIEYCRKMARALAISNSDTTNDKKTAANEGAIEAAMRLVAETSALQNQAKIAELKAAHQVERAELQQQIWRLAAQVNQSSHQNGSHQNDAENWSTLYQQWLQPLYNSNSRNEKQLQIMARSQYDLHRKLASFETQLKPVEVVPPQVIPNPLFQKTVDTISDDSVVGVGAVGVGEEDRNKPLPMALRPMPPQRDLEGELRRQISELQSQLNAMQQQNVRPVGHQEPLHSREKQLLPLYQR